MRYKSDLEHTSTVKSRVEEQEKKARGELRVAEDELWAVRDELQVSRDKLHVVQDQAWPWGRARGATAQGPHLPRAQL